MKSQISRFKIEPVHSGLNSWIIDGWCPEADVRLPRESTARQPHLRLRFAIPTIIDLNSSGMRSCIRRTNYSQIYHHEAVYHRERK
jgi:hypothetical protein